MTKRLAIVAALVLGACGNEGNGKNDILGFYPGMKRADLHKFADSKKWKCEPALRVPAPNQEFCFTMTGKVEVIFATKLEDEPVESVSLDFSTTQTKQQTPLDVQAKDISQQYGKQPDGVQPGEVSWSLQNGNVLKLNPGNQLTLENPSIEQLDFRTLKGAASTPKF
jgi:hypothetical protein